MVIESGDFRVGTLTSPTGTFSIVAILTDWFRAWGCVKMPSPWPTTNGSIKELTNMTLLRNFWNDEQGQDLIEYTLLMAFVALASAALFLGAGGSIKGIWTTTNAQLTNANTSAS